MRILLTILIFNCLSASATDYYVSASGSDANDGLSTITPFRNWQKLTDVLVAGDVGYIRGGTYVPTTAMSSYIHCEWQDLDGTSASPITITNYPGESPVYDFTGYVTTRVDGTEAVYLRNSEYVIITGLRITGFDQIGTGTGVSRGFIIDNSPNCVFNRIEIDHMGGIGFYTGTGSHNAYFLNCDSHHNADPFSTPAYGGSDGFTSASSDVTNITYDGCRAWWNSDDGFDQFGTDGVNIFRNCWSFWNGFIPGGFSTGGDGEGWKLGPTNTVPKVSTTRLLYNCLSFENRQRGFSMNTAQTQMYIVNCIAYKNGGLGFWFAWYSGYAQPFYNNTSYDNTAGDFDESGGNVGGSNNSWDGGAPTITDADFLSVSSTGMDGARNGDGSLPGLSFLRLAATSDLINAGVNINLPFCGTAPDLGPYEFNTCPINIRKRRNAIH